MKLFNYTNFFWNRRTCLIKFVNAEVPYKVRRLSRPILYSTLRKKTAYLK